MDDSIITYIKNHFPTNSTNDVANQLNLTPSQVRTIAKKHNIVKCENYKKQLKKQLIEHLKKWYEANIPHFHPSHIQEQMIFGSLLGDGFISRGAQRSINYYYQEHFGNNQKEYRLWKLSKLENLNFAIHGNYLRSISHSYFTVLYPQL